MSKSTINKNHFRLQITAASDRNLPLWATLATTTAPMWPAASDRDPVLFVITEMVSNRLGVFNIASEFQSSDVDIFTNSVETRSAALGHVIAAVVAHVTRNNWSGFETVISCWKKLRSLDVFGLRKGPFICTSNLKIHLAIRASSAETAAPALP